MADMFGEVKMVDKIFFGFVETGPGAFDFDMAVDAFLNQFLQEADTKARSDTAFLLGCLMSDDTLLPRNDVDPA